MIRMKLRLQHKLLIACLAPRCREGEEKLLKHRISAGWIKEQSMENERRAAKAPRLLTQESRRKSQPKPAWRSTPWSRFS